MIAGAWSRFCVGPTIRTLMPMVGERFEFDAEVWEHDGPGGWHFVSLPEAVADTIDSLFDGAPRRGFGSVRVRATVGSTAWSTSIFPDRKRGTFLLPVKKAVRAAEGLAAGARPTVRIEVVAEGAR